MSEKKLQMNSKNGLPEISCEIRRLLPEYIAFWKSICEIESPSADKKQVDRVGDLLKHKAEDLGFNIIEHKEEKSGNALCFVMNADIDKYPICYSAHMDTVHPIGAFGDEPVHTDDTKIYGPGTADDKGGVAAALLAMHAMKNIGFSSRPIKLIVQSDEEVGSSLSQKRTIDFMIKMAEKCPAFFNLESNATIRNHLNDGRVPAVIVRKGILTYRFHVYGKAAHSAKCFDGANALTEAAHIIIELEKLKDIKGVTCNCSLIQGGSSRNTVPDNCTFTADFRYAEDKQYSEIKTLVEYTVSHNYVDGCSCEAEIINERPAMPYSVRNEDLIDSLNEIYSRYDMPLLCPQSAVGGSDAAYVSAAGIPTIDSIGVRGGGVHTSGEWAEKNSLADCAERIAIAAMELPM